MFLKNEHITQYVELQTDHYFVYSYYNFLIQPGRQSLRLYTTRCSE